MNGQAMIKVFFKWRYTEEEYYRLIIPGLCICSLSKSKCLICNVRIINIIFMVFAHGQINTFIGSSKCTI